MRFVVHGSLDSTWSVASGATSHWGLWTDSHRESRTTNYAPRTAHQSASSLCVIGHGQAPVRRPDSWGFPNVADGARGPGGCAFAAPRFVDDEDMPEERVPLRAGLWMAVRNRPVPWILFLAAALAAVILACR